MKRQQNTKIVELAARREDGLLEVSFGAASNAAVPSFWAWILLPFLSFATSVPRTLRLPAEKGSPARGKIARLIRNSSSDL
jgi:hypothetical protein